MANYWTGFWTDINGAVAAAWPEIGANFRAVQAERINWANVVASAELTPPYVVVQAHAEEDTGEYSSGDSLAYRVHVTVHYILKMSGTDAAAAIEAKLKTLQDGMFSTTFTTLAVLNAGWAVDVSESNAVNESMLQASMPFSAGSISFDCIVGEYPP